MKTITKVFSFLLLILITLIAFLNIANTITLETGIINFKVNVGILILLCSISSSLATLYFFKLPGSNVKLKKQTEYEKLSNEIETEKVKQLEAKIQTLEEALKISAKR